MWAARHPREAPLLMSQAYPDYRFSELDHLEAESIVRLKDTR